MMLLAAETLLFSPDGGTLAARAADGAVTLWEAATGREVQAISGPPPTPENRRLAVAIAVKWGDAPGMAFTPDGKALAVATTESKQ